METNKNYYNPYSPSNEPYDLHPSQRKMLQRFLKDNETKPGFVLEEDEIKVLSIILRQNNYTYFERDIMNAIHIEYLNVVDSTFRLTRKDFEEMGYPKEQLDKVFEQRKKDKDFFKKGVGAYYLNYGK